MHSQLLLCLLQLCLFGCINTLEEEDRHFVKLLSGMNSKSIVLSAIRLKYESQSIGIWVQFQNQFQKSFSQ